MTVTEHIRRRLMEQCGIFECRLQNANLEQMRETEWSPGFELLMRNRLLTGPFRYGLMGTTGKPQYGRNGAHTEAK